MSNPYRSKHGRRHLLRAERVPATAQRPELQPAQRPFLPPVAPAPYLASPARPTDLRATGATTVTLPRVHATAVMPALRAETNVAAARDQEPDTLVLAATWQHHHDAMCAGYRALIADLNARCGELVAHADRVDAHVDAVTWNEATWDEIARRMSARDDLSPYARLGGALDSVDRKIALWASSLKRWNRDWLNGEYMRMIAADRAALDSAEDAAKRLAFEVRLLAERARSPRRVDPPTDTIPVLTPTRLAELDAAHAGGGAA